MFRHDEMDAVLDLLSRVAEVVVTTVGPNCEIVVHDLRNPEHSIVAISGNLTRRSVGAPVSDPELLPKSVDRFTADQLLYRTVSPFGKELISSTVWIRDETGHIVAALCINMDFADMKLARDLIDRSIVDLPSTSSASSLLTFATTTEDFAQIALQGVLREIGKPLHQLDREDKIHIVDRLDQAGVFDLRRAADIIANELGVSRASIYSYLKDARGELTGAAADGHN